MSPRDLTAELRAARTPAPAALRERVRLVAAAEPAPPRRIRLTWRRALVVALPVAAAVAAAVVLTRPAQHVPVATPRGAATQHGEAFRAAAPSAGVAGKTAPVAPSRKRLQSYEATLTLHEPGQRALSDATRRAQAIVASLSGYAQSIRVASGSAHIVVKVPRTSVRAALTRLGRLGTIVGETVSVQDLQAGVASTDRTIAHLQRELTALRTQTPTPAVARKIAALTARVASLQRKEAATRRNAHYATIDLRFSTSEAAAPTRHGHGPLHGLVVAFRWIGIGLVYVLALGMPLALLWLLVRAIRRRRVDALLSRA